jgi:hypothetical protein
MKIKDFLNRVYIDETENPKIQCDKCIFALVSPGYEIMLDDMLHSLVVNGDVPEAKLVVFVVDADDKCLKVIEKYNAHPIYCHSLYNVHIDSKGVVYGIYNFVDANKYLFLDADTIVLESLRSIFDSIDNIPENNLLICEDQYFYGRIHTLGDALISSLYNGKLEDFDYLLRRNSQKEKDYKHIVNTGVWAGRKEALQQINTTITNLNNVAEWSIGGFIREQFLVNLALAVNDSATILDPFYNWQLVINTFLKYIVKDEDWDTLVGYNLFALDYMEEPWLLLDILKKHEDIVSQRLFDLLNPEHQTFLLNYKSKKIKDRKERYEDIKFLQYILNGLMVNLSLFDDELLAKLDKRITKDIPSIAAQPITVEISRINKEILKRCYFNEDEQYSDIYYDSKVKVLHFSGLNKGHGFTRTFLNNVIEIKERDIQGKKAEEVNTEGINFIIPTHKKYEETTLPRLLKSLIEVNGISPKNILVVSGAWEEYQEYLQDDVMHHCVTHNSFDHTGLIDIVENNIKSRYWFNIQDTCELGVHFWDRLKAFDKKDYEYISVDNSGFLNMGLFSWKFIEENKNYIMSLKNCSKSRAILSEKTYNKLSVSTSFNTENATVMGYGDMYNSKVLRNIIYYVGIDLYKYQSNIIETMSVTDL